MSKIQELAGRQLEHTVRTQKWVEAAQGVRRDRYMELYAECYGDGLIIDTGATLSAPTNDGMTVTKVSAGANDNRMGYQQMGTGHIYLLHGSTNEAQSQRLDVADSLILDLSRSPILEVRAALNTNGSSLAAGQRAAIGLCSSHVNILNNASINLWFRAEGANNNIYTENDDNNGGSAIDQDLIDTNVDYLSGTFTLFKIDCSDLRAVTFSINNLIVRKIDFSAVALSTLVQPYCILQKDSGTGTDALIVDYVKCTQNR